MGDKKVISTRLDGDLIKSLKHLGVDLDRPINDILEEAIREVLKKYRNKSKESAKDSN